MDGTPRKPRTSRTSEERTARTHDELDECDGRTPLDLDRFDAIALDTGEDEPLQVAIYDRKNTDAWFKGIPERCER
jgi:hypothetical protein